MKKKDLTIIQIVNVIEVSLVYIQRVLEKLIFYLHSLSEKAYDKKFAIDTFNSDVQLHQNPANHGYMPTPSKIFYKAMKEIEITEDDVFIDFGSGKGKVLLMASDYNFTKVIGVELSKKMVDICKQNIANFLRHSKITTKIKVVNSDVLDYQIPDESTIFFFFNPFGLITYAELLSKLKKSYLSRQRKITIIVFKPTPEINTLFSTHDWLKKIKSIYDMSFLCFKCYYCDIYTSENRIFSENELRTKYQTDFDF